MRQIQGKQGLVRDIGRFGKPRVHDIGIPLYLLGLFHVLSFSFCWLHCFIKKSDRLSVVVNGYLGFFGTN